MNGISGNMSSQLRLTGLSGFDSETIIQQLMQAERMPLNSMYQKRTLVEWKRDAYRDITSSLRGFKSTYFDIVNRSSYMLSTSSIKVMSAKSSSSQYIDVSANSEAKAGEYKVIVNQTATADTAVTLNDLSRNISGKVTDFTLSGSKIQVTLDGVTKDIALEDYEYTPGVSSNIASKLQTAIDNAFGSGKVSVNFNISDDTLSLGTQGGATKLTVNHPENTTSGLTELGFTPGQSNRINLSHTLAELKDAFNVPMTFTAGGTVDFTINGKLITADATDTLAEVFTRINNSTEANVSIQYDELSDKVSISSKQFGAGNNLTLSDTNGNFLQAMRIVDASSQVLSMQEGQDAVIELNGSQIVRSTNNFSVNGITFTLKAEHPVGYTGDTITVSQDIDTVFNNIKSFIEKYNELIDKLNGKINEKYDRNYLPLTDDQKEEMKDDDIKKWEEKAKTGLLRNDSIIQKIVLEMRTALYEEVEGAGITLNEIGIESKSYLDRGKLYIDENKFKDALKNHPDDVVKLLNGVDPNNTIYRRTATQEQKQSRYNLSGVFHRLSDIIENNISTLRDADGNKGILLEKAGIQGDASITDNLLYDEIESYDKKINSLVDRLVKKEENYYEKFSKLETMLNQMNQQSAWLASQFSGGA